MSIRHIPLAEVIAGETLAMPLTDAAGQILLPKGATLSASVLNGLARRDILTVPVVRVPAAGAVAPTARRQEIEQRVEMRFRRAGQGEASRILRQATLEFLLEQSA